MSNNDRRSIIRELRHQLYYSNSGPEREAIRRKLDFWLYYSNQTR